MNPARKGFNFEREMAKTLSLWITKGRDKYVLWRQGGSGGMASTLRKKNIILQDKTGDIVKFKDSKEANLFSKTFFVELKRIKGGDLLPNSTFYNTIDKFFTKASSECCGKVILLIIKQDYKDAIVLLHIKEKWRCNGLESIILPKINIVGILLKDMLSIDFNMFAKEKK